MEDESLATWKYTIERVMIPLLVFVGVIGNMLNVAVLSRPCIKSTTNLYLTALAFVEIFVLLFTYLLSKQYHPHIHRQRHGGYWRMFGLSQWFYNAVLCMSIYLTVSVVMDHCSAESHAKQKSRSNLRRAKNTISMLVFICFLFTITAAFEYQLISDDKFVDRSSGEACDINDLVAREMNDNVSQSEKMQSKEFGVDDTVMSTPDERTDYDSLDNLNQIKMLNTEIFYPTNPMEDDTISTISTIFTISNQPSALRSARAIQDDFAANAFDESASSKINSTFDAAGEDVDGLPGLAGFPIKGSGANITSRCHNESFFYPIESNFAKSEVYQAIFQPITTILRVFLPLILLITFNCKLVTVVYKSNRSASLPLVMEEPAPKKHDNVTELQQFRITVLLVAVIVIFLICHTPSAFYLLYKSWQQEHRQAENSILALEHFKNFMVTLNPACKLFIYLAFDKEFLGVLKGFFINCSSTEAVEVTIDSTEEPQYLEGKSVDIDQLLLHSLSKRRYSTDFPQESRHYRIHSFSSMLPNASVTPRMSLTPSELVIIEIGRRNSQHSMHLHFNTSRRTSAARPIKQFNSEMSLTRSQSMMLKPLVKHSPDCKANDNSF